MQVQIRQSNRKTRQDKTRQDKTNLSQLWCLLFIFSSVFCVTAVFGQGAGNTPADLYDETPVKHWADAHGGQYEEWSFDVKQTCDGGYIVCGFQDLFSGRHPAIIKYAVDGEVEWDITYTTIQGRLWEVVETPDDFYAAIGDTDNGTMFIKVDRDGGLVVGPIEIDGMNGSFPLSYGSVYTRGNSMQVVEDSNGYGFIVGGNTAGPQSPISHTNGPSGNVTNLGGWDMMLLRLDDSGNYLWSNNFGGAGSYDQGNAVTVLPNSGGFVIVGRRTEVYQQNGYVPDVFTSCAGLTDNQAYIVKTDINGNSTWETSIDATSGVRDKSNSVINNYVSGNAIEFGDDFYKYEQFTDCYSGGFDYQDSNIPDIVGGACSVSGCANTSNDNAIDVLIDDNGDVVLSAYFHYNDRFDSDSPSCLSNSTCPQFKGYKEADIVLVKLRETDGHPIFAENVAYFSGVDFNARLAEDSRDGGYAIIGATANTTDLIEEGDTNNGGGMVNSYLVKTDSDGQRLWARAFNDPADINSCSFAVAATTDGGFIVVGNNNVNGDDRIAVKLYGDCQPNFQYSAGYEPSTQDLLVSSGEIQDNSVIGRHLVISDGVTFFIDPNTRLQFADTRQLTDYDDLADYPNSNILRAGITVEPGGRLNIGYNVILEGIDGCAKTTTNGGNDMWEGIEVLTDPISGKIGKVSFIQDEPQACYISDALVGIRAAKLEYDDRGRPVSVRNIGQNDIRGGSIYTQNTVFSGNMVDIEMVAPIGNFPPIQGEYFDVFDCRFISTKLADPNFIGATSYINVQDPLGEREYRCEPWGNQVHIRTEGFGNSDQRLLVSNSLFDNSNFYNQMGAGIESISSSLRVENHCIFKELQFGISATYKPTAARTFEVGVLQTTANEFNNNLWGTYILGNPILFQYENNHIDIDNLTSVDSEYENYYWYGLYIDGTTDYLVEQNQFETSGVPNIYGIGVFANNTDAMNDNWVENSDFTDMFVGVTGHLVNGFEDPVRGGQGLKIECNTYTDNQFDEFVLSQGSIAGSIHPNQGEFVAFDPQAPNDPAFLAAPAGNRFSNCWGGAFDTHIAASSNADMFNYFYHDTNGYEPHPCYNDNIVSAITAGPNFTQGVSCGETGGLKNMSSSSLESKLDSDKLTLEQLKATNGDQNEINRLENGRELGIKILMRKYLNNNQMDDAILFLNREMTPEAKLRLIPLYLAKGDYPMANSVTLSLPNHTTVWQQYKDLALLAINLQQNGLPYSAMNGTQENTVRSIAATNTVYANQAKGILYQAYNEPYVITQPVFPNQSSKRAIRVSEEANYLQLLPNPATQQVQIIWDKVESAPTQMSIYNLMGEKVYSVSMVGELENRYIDISSFPNGIYLVSIEENGAILAQQKLIISK